MGCGQAGYGDIVDPAVTYTDDTHVPGNVPAGFTQGAEGAHGHGIGGADHGIQVRMPGKEVLHGCLSPLRFKSTGLYGKGDVQACFPQSRLRAAASVAAGGDILLGGADHHDLPPSPGYEQCRQVLDGMKIVMADAGEALDILSGDDHRYAAAADRLLDPSVKYSAHQDDP